MRSGLSSVAIPSNWDNYIHRPKHPATGDLRPSLRMLMDSAYEQEGDRNVLLQFQKR